MKRWAPWLTCGVVAMALVGMGCENTAEGVKQDSAEIGAEAAQTARKVDEKAAEVGRKVDAKAAEVGQDVKEAGKTAATVAAGAGKEIKEAAKGAGKELHESTVVSPTVLGAIAQDPQLSAEGNKIDVKTENGFVYLRGTVKSQALKERASEVAKRDMARIEAKETLKNELQVKP